MTTRDALAVLKEVNETPLTLGNLLSALRKCEEWSQAYIAELLGISKQRLCDIERGRRLPSPKLAAQYAKKLGYSPAQFVRLTLQDMIDRDKLKFIVSVEPKKSRAA